MAKTDKARIKNMPGKWRCPDCDGEHEFYRKSCPLKSSTVILKQENSRLRAESEQVEDLEGLRVEIYETLNWMITALEFANQNTGMNAEDSPEMKAAKILRDKLKPESEVE